MQPILGFVEYDGLRTVHHLVGDLLAAMGRQAMHEDRVLARGGHQFCVDLVGRKQSMAKGLVHVAHRNPAIRDDRIRSLHRLMGIVDELQAGARTARPIDEADLWIESGGGRDMKRKIESLRGVDPAREHIVGIAAPSDRAPLDRAFLFLESEDVRHHLTGMRTLGQAIDHRYIGVVGEFDHRRVIEDADHDRIHETRQDAGRSGDGFAPAELHFLAGQHDRFAAKLAHRNVEGYPCPGRRFVEDHRQNLAGERPIRRALSLAAARLHAGGGVENAAEIGGRNFRKIEKMPRGRGCALAFGRAHPAVPLSFADEASGLPDSILWQAASKRATASEISSSPMISGGSSRATFPAAGMTRIPSARAAAAKSLTGTRKAMPCMRPSPRISEMISPCRSFSLARLCWG